jgi:uncharacterized damage-inducible protein DinB
MSDDVVIDEQGRPEPPMAGDEAATLLGFLDYQRATLRWKTAGLDATGLFTTIGASSLTLGALLKHMTYVEDDWFSRWLPGAERLEPWRSVDWPNDRDWELRTAADHAPDDLRAMWEASIERSRAQVATAMADGGLDHLAGRAMDDGARPSLRWIVVHMIEEYARHNGHADLLREAVDGETGE